MTTLFRPDYYAASVHEITVQWLQSHQLDTLLLDADNTLKRYHNPEPEPGVEVWLAELRQAGIRLCIVSNGLGPRIQQFANLLKLPVVCKALKPRPTGLRRAMELLGAAPAQTAMAGDQIFADIAAGRNAEVTTIFVEPIAPQDEHWYTRIKRPCERWLIRRWKARGVFPPRVGGSPDKSCLDIASASRIDEL